MYGHWLDTCGNAGYTRIFIYIIAIMVVGVINGVATVVYKRNMWLRAWFRWKAELRLLRRSEGIVRRKKG